MEAGMGLYKYLREAWQQNPDLFRNRLVEWRKEPAAHRIEYPSRLDRARSLGYKAKQGIFIVRVRLPRGGRLREKFKGGRKPKKMRRMKVINVSYQTVAEQRANKKFHNCEVLNSYFVAKDGIYDWFEVIVIDRAHPAILADPHLQAIAHQRGRVYRGLTSSARKSRGLRKKGTGAEKVRPSRRAKGGLIH